MLEITVNRWHRLHTPSYKPLNTECVTPLGFLCTPLCQDPCGPLLEVFTGSLSLDHELLRSKDHSGPNYLWAQALDDSSYFTELVRRNIKWKSFTEHKPSAKGTEMRVLLILADGIPEAFLEATFVWELKGWIESPEEEKGAGHKRSCMTYRRRGKKGSLG